MRIQKPRQTPRLARLAALVAPAAAATVVHAQIFTWTDTTTTWHDTTAWNPAGIPNNLTSHSAFFPATAAVTNQPNLGATAAVLGLTLDNSGGDTWQISGLSTGTLFVGGNGITLVGTGTSALSSPVNVAAPQTWTIPTGATLQNNMTAGNFGGAYLLTKAGGGSLELGAANTGNAPFYGGYHVADGTLLSRNANAGSGAFRNNRITLGNTGYLMNFNSANDVRYGEIAGAGTIDATGGGAAAIGQIFTMANAVSSATVISGSGSINIRGIATQTFTGDTSSIAAGSFCVQGSRAAGVQTGGFTLAGNAVLNNPATQILVRGGQFTLDNSTTNLSTRLGTGGSNTLAFFGGGVNLIGHTTGTTQNTGAMSLSIGMHTLTVTQPAGALGATVFGFNNGATNFSLRGSTQMCVNFVGEGGVLGAAGVNPKIVFTGGGVPFTHANGLLANSAGGATTGWAIVNGTDWAGYGANGIVAVPGTARDETNLGSAASGEATAFTPSISSTVTTLSANFVANALKINPTNTGQSIAAGSFNLTGPAFMLVGPRDFTITGGVYTNGATRYYWVTDPGAMLSVTGNFAGANQPFNKAGDGFLSLEGATNQLAYTTVQNVNLLGGVLRVTSSAIGGFSAAGSASTTFNMRGGVLELSGGGTYVRALGLTGTGAGGGINFDGSGTSSRASGGFSAFGGEGTVTLVTTIGGSTPVALLWGSTSQVGMLQDGFTLIFGSLRADSRINLSNDLDLNNPTSYNAREIRVVDNPLSAGDTARLTGIVAGGSNTDLLKTGPGTLELSGNNTYTGSTLVAEGVLLLSNNSALGGGVRPTLLGNRGGSADAAMFTTGNFTIPQPIIVPAGGTGAARLGGIAAGGSTFSGAITLLRTLTATAAGGGTVTLAGVISGPGGVVKQGPGTVVLSNNNSYGGVTTVNQGALLVNGTHTGGGTYSVNAGGVLGGTGTIGSKVNVGTGGTLAPGASIGVLTVTDDVTLDQGSTLSIEVDVTPLTSPGGSTDQLAVIGGVLLGDGMTPSTFPELNFVFTPAAIGAVTPNKTFVIVSNDGVDPVQGEFAGKPDDTLVTAGLLKFAVDYQYDAATSTPNAGNDIAVTFVEVPEPAGAVALAAAALLYRRRRS